MGSGMLAAIFGGETPEALGRVAARRAGGALAAALLLVGAALEGPAAAQSDGDLGRVARDPVAATQSEADRLCSGRLIPSENVNFGDFTGDGIEDALILLDMNCPGSFDFCSPIGCSHRIWVGRNDGRYEYVNNIFARESRTARWRRGPALQFDDGPIWAFNGREFEPVGTDDGFSDDRSGGDDFGADDRFGDDIDRFQNDAVPPRYDDGGFDDEFEGVWSFDVFRRGVGVAAVTNRAGARLSFSCNRRDFLRRGDLVMRFLPPAFRDAELPARRGASMLFDFFVDRRVADTRLMRRREDSGPLVEPSIEARGPLVRRIRAGNTLIIREASGAPFGRFRLRRSSRAISNLISYCGR